MKKVLLVLLFLIAVDLSARSRRHPGRRSAEPGDFDYYVLSLSWAPDFCAQPDVQKNDRECGSGRHVSFVVHGLWPQFEQGRSPENCAPARPVSDDIVSRMLAYMPAPSLIQHEWRSHGTCTALPAAQYFDQVRRAADSVSIPSDLKNLSSETQASPQEIERKFAAANPSFPRDAFRISCKRDELAELRVCFSRDLKPRACSESVSECPDSRIEILPVR